MVHLAKVEYKCLYIFLYMENKKRGLCHREGRIKLSGAHIGKEGVSHMVPIPESMESSSTPDQRGRNHTLMSRNDPCQQDHVVQFYESDDSLLDSVSDFIGAGLEDGAACIVIVTPEHREALAQRLQANGGDPARAHAQGKYFALDATTTLAQVLVEGSPDPQKLTRIIGSIIDQAVKGEKRMRIFGEMVVLLWQNGNQAAALDLETFWNESRSTTHPFSLLCGYPTSLFTGQENQKPFSKLCELHSHIIPNEDIVSLSKWCIR